MLRSNLLTCAGFVLGASLLSIHSVSAQPAPSGTVVAVVQASNASGPGGSRMLEETKPVFTGDRINTGAVGRAQIEFNDQTRLVVASNSSVVIDRFVLSDDPSKTGAAMRFARGTFRFITGEGPSGNYELKTPTATISVRGTEFDITHSNRGTEVLVFEGAVEVCNRISGECATVDRYCGSILAGADGSLTKPESKSETAELIRTNFPLAQNQKGLKPGFKVTNMGCGGSRSSGGNGQGMGSRGSRSASTGGGGKGGCGGGNTD